MSADDATSTKLPWAALEFPSVTEPTDNATTDEKIALGRLLFYDPIVSSDRATACATCHSEVWGMTDGLARSIGQGAGLLSGPGRDGPNMVRRNAPTLWNVGYRETQFWDGRAASLEDQVHFPFESPQELNRPFDDVIADVKNVPTYVRLFQKAFPTETEPVTNITFARAVAAFERSIVTRGGLYAAYVAGDTNAMTDGMIRGMNAFAKEGCASCHVPPLFSSERFEDRGVPKIPGVVDDGRYEVTHLEADRNRYKVPTLRNAHDTGPFFHTGAVDDITEAVHHEVDYSVAHDGAAPLDDAGVADLTTFIVQGLFDSTTQPVRPLTVPSGLKVPLDGFSLHR